MGVDMKMYRYDSFANGEGTIYFVKANSQWGAKIKLNLAKITTHWSMKYLEKNVHEVIEDITEIEIYDVS